VSDLQHPSVDAAVLEKSGGGAARVEKRTETGRVEGKIGQFESLSSGSTVCIRIITAQVDFF